MKIILLTLVAAVGFCQLSVSAQAKKFRWSTELCEFEGTYDAAKYSAAQLKNTVKLFIGGEFNLTTQATVWRHEDIAGLSVEALDREYAAKSGGLKTLDIVDQPYWETRRQKYLAEIADVYRLSRVTIAAYQNPSLIRDFKSADHCVRTYADALISGGDELLEVWRRVNENSRQNNSDPERLRRIFDEQYNSSDRLKFARVEVMSFGWWNCANNLVRYVEGDGSEQEHFKKLFKKVRTISCDEP